MSARALSHENIDVTYNIVCHLIFFITQSSLPEEDGSKFQPSVCQTAQAFHFQGLLSFDRMSHASFREALRLIFDALEV